MKTTSRIAYADTFSGISGDMFLGALLHCGLDKDRLTAELGKLSIGSYQLTVSAKKSCGIGAIKVTLQEGDERPFRHLSSIREVLEKADLGEKVRSRALAVFEELARAEAKVHDIDVENVHFHEVGAVDTIVDIVGVVAGLDILGIDELHVAPLPMPRGFVSCDHGRLPLPAPAVCEILQGLPCYGVEQSRELVTPTGAALVKVLASRFGQMPPMAIESTGYGAGSHELAGDQPNLFRLIIGTSRASTEEQQVEVIETHLDDWQTEGFPYLCDVLFDSGALDVSLTPMLMKKGRPGYDLQVIAPLHLAPDVRRAIFCETSSIGLRFRREARQTLPRRQVEVITRWGTLTAKEVQTPEGTRVYPEFEQCLNVARQHGVSLQSVYQEVIRKTRP